ncbi:hypothetical protein [Mesorhizobium prunaredense]|uniref:hypothetical protein n=1 Tax=Mesorhizobium prunaredense TaxID=1631249 RepID=UPI001AECB2CC|nr:hypothetical protein [Mesorhizobium prunaredense]
MMKVLAAAVLTLGLAGGAMAQTNGTGSDGGNESSSSGGAPSGGGGNSPTAEGDPGGAPDKCKTGATGKTTTTDPATTDQQAKNCP